MNRFSPPLLARLTLLSCGVLPLVAAGCQSSVGGQTLPSAYYLKDDIQYFPAGPENQLTNQKRVLEQYRLEQQGGRGPVGPLP